MGGPALILVDWGTSAFRAWLVEAETGAILGHLPDGEGMRALAGRSFAAYCADRLGPWLARGPRPPVYMAGMVGAPTGWIAAPQPALPLRPEELAAHVMAAPGMDDAWILPGVRVDSTAPDRVDVMRGEEVQILGALHHAGRSDAVLCLPGTHSKWARVTNGVLDDFTTFMTGEIYGALLSATLLGQGCDPSAHGAPGAFQAGLAEAERTGGAGGLLAHAFAARTRRLYRDLGTDDVPAFLSGLLIGEELAGATALGYLPQDTVLLVGATTLTARYGEALSKRGIAPVAIPAAEATLSGALMLARMHLAAGHRS